MRRLLVSAIMIIAISGSATARQDTLGAGGAGGSVTTSDDPVRHDTASAPSNWSVDADSRDFAVDARARVPVVGASRSWHADTRGVAVETPMYAVAGGACLLTQERPTTNAASCSVHEEYGPQVVLDAAPVHSNRSRYVGFAPWTNWSAARLPLDLQIGTRSTVAGVGGTQENMSHGWASEVANDTPRIAPFGALLPAIALNWQAYPNVSLNIDGESGSVEALSATEGRLREPPTLGVAALAHGDPAGGPAAAASERKPVDASAPEERGRAKHPARISVAGTAFGKSLIATPAILLLVVFGGIAIAWTLYSRLKGHVLDHDARRACWEAIAENPGVNEATLRRKTSLTRPTLRHHVRELLKRRLVRIDETSGRSRYYVAGAPMPPQATTESLSPETRGSAL